MPLEIDTPCVIDTCYITDVLTKLLNIPSPTGFTDNAIAFVEQLLSAYPGIEVTRTRKGGLLVSWQASAPVDDRQRALTAHVDTLGAMVKQVKANGRLQLTKIGGFPWNTVEGEGCTVFTHAGDRVRGALLLTKASCHVFGSEVGEMKREDDTLEVRLDARTCSADETRALGIAVGDFVAFDPRVELNNGFIRSRHLDNKAGVAVLLSAIHTMITAGLSPTRTTHFFISAFEEVGHGGAAGIPAAVDELLVVDMAAVGDGQQSDEFHATLCVKDSSGPFHHGFSNRLRALADQHAIPYTVDIYPHYSSDGRAWWHAGADAAVALIGPGVDASHNYERTHTEALRATTQWVIAYLLEK